MARGRCAGEERSCRAECRGRRSAQDVEDDLHVALSYRLFAIFHEQIGDLRDDWVVPEIFDQLAREREVREREFVAWVLGRFGEV